MVIAPVYAPRMVSLSIRRLLLSLFRILTSSLRFPLCGMRALSPMLMMLLSSPHRIGSPNSYSSTDSSRDLKLIFVGSRHTEQLNLRSQQRIVSTVEDSVFRTEMDDLESQEEDVPKSILFFKPMSWLGQIRTHRRDETWSTSL